MDRGTRQWRGQVEGSGLNDSGYIISKTFLSLVVKRKSPNQEAEEKEANKKKKVDEKVSSELDSQTQY